MSAWSKTPPTHKEWLGSNSNGYWWVKFQLAVGVWHTEIVFICDEMVSGKPILNGGRLVADGTCVLTRFYLDDLEATRDLYWQPVAPALDNEKDKEPLV